MPGGKIRVTTTTPDALANSILRDVVQPSIINLWAAGVTGTDDISLLIGSRQILPVSDVNIEASADVIDSDRDQILFNEVVEPGRLTAPVTVTTEMQFLLSIKPIV